MRTKYSVRLPEAERAWLHTLVGQGTAPARRLTHARILLKANQGEAGPGWTDAAIAGEQEAHLIALACGAPPTGQKRWTLRLLADHLVALEVVATVSHETVRQTLQQTNSSPT